MFHRIDQSPDPLSLSISFSRLKEIALLLKQQGWLLSIDKAIKNLCNNRTKRQINYVLTFDDGYSDNMKLLFLAKEDIPSVIYITTNRLGHIVLWPYRLINAIFHATENFLDLTSVGLNHYQLIDNQQKQDTVIQINHWLKQFEPKRIEELIDMIEEITKPNSPIHEDRMLTLEEINLLNEAGVAIGAHTRNHVILTKVDIEKQREEIEGCYRDLKKILKKNSAFHFAYPNGTSDDFNDEIVSMVKQAGFQSAVTTIYGINKPGDDLFTLKRIAVDDNSFLTPWSTFSKCRFLSETSGIMQLLLVWIKG